MSSKKKARASYESPPSLHVIQPKSASQEMFLDSIRTNKITFGMGSAGSGKTYLAGMMAADALQRGLCRKIIVCRPIVEAAGEKLGFLPGDLEEKCEPYLRPLFDVFELYWYNALGQFKNLQKNKTIEVSPLAYMRGRNFEDVWILCDEAQNMNADMMKMLLTRFATGSKLIITGDQNQRDRKDANGFEAVQKYLSDVDDIGMVNFSNNDIQRDPIVKDILDRWPEE